MVGVSGTLALIPKSATAGAFQSRVVIANPADFTPHVLDGEVHTVAQVGAKIVLGGTFTQARNASGGLTLTRDRILAFNRTTGVIDGGFRPNAKRVRQPCRWIKHGRLQSALVIPIPQDCRGADHSLYVRTVQPLRRY